MNGTPDREKVAAHIEYYCENPNLAPLHYYGGELAVMPVSLMRDALALLKAQEARVMTLEELEDWDGAVFFEAFETDMYYALIENVELTAGMDGEYVLVNVVPGEHHRRIWGGEHYGSIWRCWTSRPTDEQREKEPWNG